MTTYGFVGLGVMGRPMVRNLLRAGHEVVVSNRSRAPVEALASEGAHPAETPREVAERARQMAVCVADADAVRGVAGGPDGMLAGGQPGDVHIDHSTIDPATTLELSAAAAERGIVWLDAPVSGGEQGAVDGSLAIMVGGEADAVESARRFLEVNGATVRRVGPSGAGQTAKAANQLLVAGALELVAEAVLLLEAAGADAPAALAVLRGGLAGSAVLDAKGARMHARDFEPSARLDLHRKDLGIALDIARNSRQPLPVTALVAQLFEAAGALGHGAADHAAVLRAIEALGSGTEDAGGYSTSDASTPRASRNRETPT